MKRYQIPDMDTITGRRTGIKPTHLLALGLPSIIIFGVISYLEYIGITGIPLLNFMDIFVIGLLLALLPTFLYLESKTRWVRSIEHQVPIFLKNLAENNSSGLNLYESVKIATTGRYGTLTAELKKVNSQISWGIPMTEAMELLSQRVPSRVLARAVILINEATHSGGETAKVLQAAAKEAYQIELSKRARESQNVIYMALIYIIFIVFIGIFAALLIILVPQFTSIAADVAERSTSSYSQLSFEAVNTSVLFYGLYCLWIVISLGNGLICGQLMSGRMTMGFKHSFIMLFVTLAVFKAAHFFI